MSDYSSNFPTQRPKLNLVFNSGSGKLDSRISYSRSSTGTYMSNERHLSSENLITQSQFSGWTELTSPTVTAAYANGPDGSSNTATRLQSASGANRFFYSTATSWTSGQQYTVSCWVKSNTGVAQTFAFFLPTTAYASADLTTHATDWTRITATFTAATSSIYCGFKLLSANTTDLSIWGFQVNSGANALDYQATSGSIHREFASTLKTVSADEPRFEYSATDGQSEGLLIEAQAVNLQRYGSDFASWSIKANLVPHSNQAIAPNGLLEADLMVPTTGNDYHYIYDGQASVASGTTYTFSVYLKSAGYRYAQLLALGPLQSSGHVTYDLEAGTLSASGAHSGTIESVGNGWYRASATVTAASTTTSGFLIAGADSLSNGRNPQTTGNAYDGWLCWGAQLETGSSASSLVDTGTGSSQLSRAADSCSVVDATLFNSGEHTIIWEGDLNATTVDARMANLTDGSTDNRVRLDYDNGSSARFVVEADDVLQVDASYATDLSVGTHKVAGTLKTNEAQLIVDGTRRQLDTSAVVPSGLDQLAIMKTFNGSSSVHDGNGHCKRLTYYNVALSQAEAESLTSNP